MKTIVYNEDIASMITQEQFDKIEEKIDDCVYAAVDDNLDTKGWTRHYNVDYHSCDGYVVIEEVEPFMEIDGVGIVLYADIKFKFDMESGGGGYEERWDKITEYCYDGEVMLTDEDGEEIINYEVYSGWKKY